MKVFSVASCVKTRVIIHRPSESGIGRISAHLVSRPGVVRGDTITVACYV